ncbi:hypothetical protein V1L52_12435 [Treponema sp. HNW]|uniref:hypothetical protein n=1 Tax=Treponema sp. HNW TaxID=3116654 RepID=UPI003D13F4FE
MIWFFIKKNFCDGWDNLLFLALFNLIIIALLSAAFFTVSALIDISSIAAFAVLAVFICLINVLLFAFSDSALRLADFKSVSIKESFAVIPSVWKTGLFFGITVLLLIFMAAGAIPFYFGMKNMAGLILGSVLFWVLVVAVLSLQWFMPLQSYFGGSVIKNVKKSFILFFDNTGFSVFMFIYSCIVFVLSAFLGFMAPGITGVILGYNNALRLRMYKYDWLEEHSELPAKQARRSIPWDELLAEDRETLGPRDFKSFIFPWK